MYFANHQWLEAAPLWLAWLLSFVIVEVYMIIRYRNHPTEKYHGGTLSELIWRLKKHPLTRALLIAFGVVLVIHFSLEI